VVERGHRKVRLIVFKEEKEEDGKSFFLHGIVDVSVADAVTDDFAFN
jgi:hypothetical protein